MNNEIKTTPLFKTIKSIIDEADVEGLLSSGAPEDEYDNESATITVQLRPDMTMPQIAVTVKDVMNRSFGENRTTEDFFGIALEIYENFGELIDLSSGKPEFKTCIRQDDDSLADPDRFFCMTPGEVIDSMFAETKQDGTYWGFEPYHDTHEPKLLKYTLRWNEADRDYARANVEKLLHALRRSAEEGFIPSSLEKYLFPYKLDYSFLLKTGLLDEADPKSPWFAELCKDLLDEIEEKIEFEEECSEAESMAFDLYVKALHKAADERVGAGLYSYELVQFARRYHRLIQLGAPRIIINNEAGQLAQAYVYHKYGEFGAL